MAPNDQPNVEMADAAIPKRRRLSIIWVIPLVAITIGAWLAYETITEQGPHVKVRFETAEGLEIGKTKVRYRDVEIGLVDDIKLAEDRSHVLVGIRMSKSAEPYLTASTNFWVVRARLDVSGVSGLSTILSGAYIEIEPGAKGPRKLDFVGLETPPVVRMDAPGKRFALTADKLGSLSARSPIFYRGIRVGEILGYELTDARRAIKLHAFVRAPFDLLVLNNSNFWNVSGIEVAAGVDGLKVKIESVQALLTGGVAFESSPDLPEANPAAEGKAFPLYPNHEAIREAAIVEEVPYVLHFEGSVRGLSSGAPVEFQGVRVGTVQTIQPQIDLVRNAVRISVFIVLEPQRLKGESEIIGNEQEKKPYALISALVEHGLRAQLQTGSLLTGQKFVSLDFHPNEPKQSLGFEGKIPELPTVPSTLSEIADSATRLLNKLSDLPLDLLVGDIRSTIGTLDSTLQATRGLAKSAQDDLRPTLSKFRDAAEAARGALTQAEVTLSSVDATIGENSEVRQRVSDTLRELASAARSIRDLADYLERHPEALVKGKSGEAR